MNILFVVPYVPSLIRVRPFNLIRSLRDQGHEVSIVTLWTSEEEREEIRALEKNGFKIFATRMPAWRSIYNCLKGLPSNVPLQAVYSWNPELAAQMQSFFQSTDGIQTYDVVHIEHLRGVNYGLHLNNYLLRQILMENRPRFRSCGTASTASAIFSHNLLKQVKNG